MIGRLTWQRKSIGRSSKIHDPRIIDFQTTASDSGIISVIFGSEQVASGEMIDEELHDFGSRLHIIE